MGVIHGVPCQISSNDSFGMLHWPTRIIGTSQWPSLENFEKQLFCSNRESVKLDPDSKLRLVHFRICLRFLEANVLGQFLKVAFEKNCSWDKLPQTEPMSRSKIYCPNRCGLVDEFDCAAQSRVFFTILIIVFGESYRSHDITATAKNYEF